MDTLAFLNLTLPAAPAYFVQLLSFPDGPAGDSKSGGSHKCQSREQMAAFIARAAAKGWDVYISVAGFTAEAKGHYASFLPTTGSHQAHWVDLDCGPDKPYKTIREGVSALIEFLKAHPRIPAPLMVVSGNGVHLYWPYTTSIDPLPWKQQAWALRQIMERAGLQIDGKCSIDPVRLLRPPGTHNRKDPTQPKNVYVPNAAQHNYQPLAAADVFAAFDAYRDHYGISIHVETDKPAGKESYDSDLAAGMREPYTFAGVASACMIAEWHRRNGGAPLKAGYPGMSNPTWMAVGAIYKFADEGEELFHEHAKQYPGYSRRKAQQMLNRIDHSGPRCATLANTKFEQTLCSNCKMRGQITSPVVTGTQRVIMLRQQPVAPQQSAIVQQTTAQPAAAASLFGGGEQPMFNASVPIAQPMFMVNGPYRATERGVCTVSKDETGMEKFGRPFLSHHVVSAVRLREDDGVMQYRFEFDTNNPGIQPDARRVSVTLTAENLGKQSGEVFTILLNRQIVPKDSGKVNHVMGYLREWAQHTLMAGDDVIASQMGHQRDGSFVLGNQRYKHGEIAEVYLSNTLDDAAAGYYPRGTLEGWQAAARKMCEGNSLRHYQALLGLSIAFGAPLMKYTDQQGALISFCTGESGRGKTTTGNLMSSVWGEPKRLLGNAHGDSPAHIYNQLARTNSLPVLLDEATSTDPERIAMLLNLLANGNAPGRANANGTNRRTLNWRTLGVTNTNHQISGKLNQRRTEGAGEQARLLEFMFDQSPMLSDPAVHEAIYSFTEKNFGVAGPIYAKAITADEDAIRAAVGKRLDSMRQHWQIDPRERMWTAAMAAMFTGLAIAKQLGIVNWPVDFGAFAAYLHDQMKTMRAAYAERHQPLMVQMADMLGVIMQRHGITVTPATAYAGAPQRVNVAESDNMPHETYARHDTIEGTVAVSARIFNEFAKENGFAMRQEAMRSGYMEPGDRSVRLGAKVMELDGRDLKMRCFIINYRKLISEVLPTESATVTHLQPAS